MEQSQTPPYNPTCEQAYIPTQNWYGINNIAHMTIRLRLCLIQFVKSVAAVKKMYNVNHTAEVAFSHKQHLSCSTIFIAPQTILLAFSFLLFQTDENRLTFQSCFKGDKERKQGFIVILFKQLITFAQHIVYSSFFIVHIPQ